MSEKSTTLPQVMYAVIATGGKQEKVSEGQVIDIERIADAKEGGTISLAPVLAVNGTTVISAKDKLEAVTVSAKVLGEVKGKKIHGFTYKNKSNQRKRWGHRQRYTRVEITSITGAK